MSLWKSIAPSIVQSKAIATFRIGVGFILLLGEHPIVVAESSAYMPSAAAPHACVIVSPGETRPEFGCFRIGIAKNLRFSSSTVFWHLRVFPTRAAASDARSPSGIVVEEDGRVWLSEFGPRDIALRGGRSIAVIGPLSVLSGNSYDAEIAYSVMASTDRSRVHTHSGPEAWYVLAGAQCLEMPGGTIRGHAGETMSAAPNVPMQLSVTGNLVARALTLVIHASRQEFGIESDWQPRGACQWP